MPSNREEAFPDTNEFQYRHLRGFMEKELFGIINKENSEHYIWGNNCDGWHFVNTESLSVIKERMPALTQEKLHYHEKSRQFFYILSGIATLEINERTFNINQNCGIHIKPGIKHRISNNCSSYLEFLVISEPKAHGDRINLE